MDFSMIEAARCDQAEEAAMMQALEKELAALKQTNAKKSAEKVRLLETGANAVQEFERACDELRLLRFNNRVEIARLQVRPPSDVSKQSGRYFQRVAAGRREIGALFRTVQARFERALAGFELSPVRFLTMEAEVRRRRALIDAVRSEQGAMRERLDAEARRNGRLQALLARDSTFRHVPMDARRDSLEFARETTRRLRKACHRAYLQCAELGGRPKF
ncbi:hypothetical protein M3Y99_01361000 [Aphelenchoides fujianensis]|nr:hypothetical protein M3Y99_01361000 [Aphelenchoides fujianensis]